ncbi:UNVERIFIED_CONTAM: Copia protein [Sesamum radiatum]|uniref:Copia protein n=1 Tax=Sesamum radiatum TaxID=300843 RepID=A0AAW2LBI9_SESRA
MYTKTARDLWLDLHARYGQSNEPMIYEILRGIVSISQGTLTLTGYFSRFKELWDEIVWLEPPPKCLRGGCSCDISKVLSERMEAHQVMQFLMGLHDSFDAERSQILMLDPLPNVQKKKRGYVDKRSLICDNCHKPGHSKDSCFKLYGVPEWYKSLSDQKKKGTGGKALMANVTKTVDASSSEQNIGDLVTELLKIVKSINTPSDPVTTTYANYVHIDEEFAVSQLAKSNSVSLTFTQTGCILQDQASRKTLALGTLYEKLYVLNRASFNAVHPSSPPVMSCSVSHCTDVVWHRRLGHASMRVIKQLPIPMTSLGDSAIMPCTICPLAKQSRVPFPLSNSHATCNFDLLHIDLWGPYREYTISGCNYVLTIVDDHSRALWTYLLKHKNQVSSILANFCSMVHTQFDTKIKTIRSDNGTEFFNSECKQLFQSLGLIHQTSCTYTPQQNGRVERKHRHLLDVARAILFQASLPNKFWGDAILTATHLINRTPSQHLRWKSPFQILYDRVPSYDHLRTFGSLCFVTVIDPQRAKFHKRALRCILLGYGQIGILVNCCGVHKIWGH